MKAKHRKARSARWNYTQPPVPPFPKVEQSAEARHLSGHQNRRHADQLRHGPTGRRAQRQRLSGPRSDGATFSAADSKAACSARCAPSSATPMKIGANWGADYDHPGLFEIAGSTKSASTVDTLKAGRQGSAEASAPKRSLRKNSKPPRKPSSTASSSISTRRQDLNRLLTYRYYGYPDDFIFQYQKAVAR